MTAAVLYQRALASGVTLRLVDGKVKAAGSHEALAELVPQLRGCKPELIEFLAAAHKTAAALIAAAMRVCDHYDDNDAKREEMRQDILATPHHLRQELLDYFSGKPTPLH